MARTELDRAVLPSLLDRLTDEAHTEPADHATTREESARVFKRSVQRDVEWLLNTRRSMINVSAAFPEVLVSAHEYGLPDTSGLSFATAEGRQQLTDDITETLRRFEPRLVNVTVRLQNTAGVTASDVRFSIEATLRMDPSPEQVIFDTVLEIASGAYDVDSKA